MKCPRCGAYNKPEYKKCYVCSAMLPQEYVEEKHIEANNEKQKSMWTQSAFKEGDVPDARQKENREPIESEQPTQNDQNSFYDLGSMDEEDSQTKKEYSIYAKREDARQRGIWGDEKSGRYTRRGKGNIPVVALEDESGEKITKKRKRGSRYAVEPLSKNAQRIRNFREGQEIGIVVPPEPEQPKEDKRANLPKKTTYKKRFSIKWGRLILVCMFAALIIFGAVIGISAVTGKVSESMFELFQPRNPLPNNGQPLIERILKDGQTWHTITFYGDDGDKILVEDESHSLKRTLTIIDNMAVLSLDDYSYIPTEKEEEYYGEDFTYVDVEAWHFDSEGMETKLNVPTYRISVPEAPLNVIHPEEQGMTYLTSQVLVKVKVEPESRVIIDEKNMSGNVDDDGFTSTYVFLDDEGMNKIPITVEIDGYKVNNYELLVYSPEKDVDIKLEEPPTITSMAELRIDGITEPNATVTMDDSEIPLLIDYISVGDDGRFFIKIRLKDFGENHINLSVTSADGTRTAEYTHIIYRTPLEGAYTSSAWVLDYGALSSAANNMIGQVYFMEGTVAERIDTTTKKLYLFNAGTDAEPRYVIIEYNGLYDLEVGDFVYKVYADVIGKHDNYPALYARFIYESNDQNRNGIDDEEEGYSRDDEEEN